MISRVKNFLKRQFRPEASQLPVTPSGQLSQRELVKQATVIPHWEKKIELYNQYDYSAAQGTWSLKGSAQVVRSEAADLFRAEKINYGCGGNIKPGWLNVDLYPSEQPNYKQVNLLEKHPFADNSVRLGFSEDVLEHLTQAESIFFLSEIFRTLATGGVFRLSFPGLEGVLLRHYTPATELRIRQGEFEAYTFWDHIHFYSREELSLIAKHIGFNAINFVEYGQSNLPELCGLDTRESQIGLNTYVELVK